MTNTERVELVKEAMELVSEARSLAYAAVEGTNLQSNYDAYGEYGFQTLLGEGNPYDDSLQTLLNEFEE